MVLKANYIQLPPPKITYIPLNNPVVNKPNLPEEIIKPNMKIGKYTIEKNIGRGNFGSVWRATRTDGLKFAIKVFNPSSSGLKTDAIREIGILKRLKGKQFVAQMEEVLEYNNYILVVCELAVTDLSKIIKPRPPADKIKVTLIHNLFRNIFTK